MRRLKYESVYHSNDGIYHKSFLATGEVSNLIVGGDSIPSYWLDKPHWHSLDKLKKFSWVQYSEHQKTISYLNLHNISIEHKEMNRYDSSFPAGIRTFPLDNYTFWRNCARSSLLRMAMHLDQKEKFEGLIGSLDIFETIPKHWITELEKQKAGIAIEKKKFRLAMHYSRVQYGLIEITDLPLQTQKWLFRNSALKLQATTRACNGLLMEQCVTSYFEDGCKLLFLLNNRSAEVDWPCVNKASNKMDIYCDYIQYYLTEVATNIRDLSIDYCAAETFSQAFLSDKYTYFKSTHNLCPLKQLEPLCKPQLLPDVIKRISAASIYSTSM